MFLYVFFVLLIASGDSSPSLLLVLVCFFVLLISSGDSSPSLLLVLVCFFLSSCFPQVIRPRRYWPWKLGGARMEKASAMSSSSVAGFCFAADVFFTLFRMDECTILHMRHGRANA